MQHSQAAKNSSLLVVQSMRRANGSSLRVDWQLRWFAQYEALPALLVLLYADYCSLGDSVHVGDFPLLCL